MTNIRIAKEVDIEPIFKLLEEIAPEVPLSIKNDEARKLLLGKVSTSCESQKSLVATDNSGLIIGFILVMQDMAEEFLLRTLFELPYIAVAKDWRGNKISSAMIEKVKNYGMPLSAVVKHGNKSDMAGRFVKWGFKKSPRVNEDLFSWP